MSEPRTLVERGRRMAAKLGLSLKLSKVIVNVDHSFK
jgi:hypothetical protein